MGKEAVRETVKKVRLVNVKTKEETGLSFSAGTLEMRCAYALRLDGAFSDGDIRNFLMQHL